ncbi:MAG: DUF58 domain-containing protein [Acidobacteria bacterium]|nr:DUF58 domain-containing protein [Acidobacteriota bacterium]
MTPSRRLLGVCGLVAIAAAADVARGGFTVTIAAGALVTAAALSDLLASRRLPAPDVTRAVPSSIPVGNWCTVRLRLAAPAGRAIDVEVFDHHPPLAEVEGMPLAARVPAGGWVEISYRVRPRARGAMTFGRAEVRLRSALGLFDLSRRAGGTTTVRVCPDYAPAIRYALLAVDNRTSQIGIRRRPRRGEGTELHALRDYRPGDPLRQIDWKATSRRGRLVSREYQDERDQQVVFLLDCGRSMRAVDDGESHFDHALKSLLLLAYVALKQGDSVGLLAFGETERRVAPMKGPAAMRRLLDAVHDLSPGASASDIASAAARFSATQRKRALVVVLTNLRDEEGAEAAAVLRRLRRRHLVMVASLRESALDRALATPVATFDDALRVGAVHHYLEARRRAHRAISGHGIRLLDVKPSSLPVAIVNRYLDVKGSGSL